MKYARYDTEDYDSQPVVQLAGSDNVYRLAADVPTDAAGNAIMPVNTGIFKMGKTLTYIMIAALAIVMFPQIGRSIKRVIR